MFTITTSSGGHFGQFTTEAEATPIAGRIFGVMPDLNPTVVPLPDGVTPMPVHEDFLDN